MTRHLSPLCALLLAAALSACGGGGTGGTAATSVQPEIHVDAATGDDDSGDGSSAHPFRTIHRGIQQADVGDVVHVGPGTYDAAGGEHFPIRPGFGVTIQGTEIRTTESTLRLTHVVGGGIWSGDLEGRLHATFVPSEGDRLVGMIITDPQPAIVDGPRPAAILLALSGATVESCALVDSDRGVRFLDGVAGCLVKDCPILRNGIGIFVDGLGDGNRVEGCMVQENGVGVMGFGAGVDFGGGAAGSGGHNAFVSSLTHDFVHFTGLSEMLFADDCSWDHAPPTLAVGSPAPVADTDVWVYGPGAVSTTGAQLYQAPGTGVVPPGGGAASP